MLRNVCRMLATTCGKWRCTAAVIATAVVIFLVMMASISKRNLFQGLLASQHKLVGQRMMQEPSRYEGHVAKKETRNETITILLWRHPWGVPTEGITDGLQVDNCRFTYDREKLPDARAVVFHYSSLDEEPMPWSHCRDPRQYFIFYTMESPSYIRNVEKRNFEKFDDGFINWTMSYRLDADVYYPYAHLDKQILSGGKERIDDVIREKKNVALWLVSNCNSSPAAHVRMRYAQALVDAGLPVHRYGACFNNKKEYDSLTPETRDSFKFYLAFENVPHCRDYVTEKFWYQSIASDRVPIVWGPLKRDIEKVAPNGSYIHTEDFATPKELVEYLLYLDKHDDEYRKFFAWREKPDMKTKQIFDEMNVVRERVLCDKIKKNKSPRKTISSMFDAIFLDEPEECIRKAFD